MEYRVGRVRCISVIVSTSRGHLGRSMSVLTQGVEMKSSMYSIYISAVDGVLWPVDATGRRLFCDAIADAVVARSGVLSTILEASGEAKLPDSLTPENFHIWHDITLAQVNGTLSKAGKDCQCKQFAKFSRYL